MATTDREKAKTDITDLVDRLEQILRSGKEGTFSEADVSSKFILPLLDALGWDTKDIDQVKEQKRTLSGLVDYTLSVNRKPRLLLELKKFDEQLDGYREVHGRKETFPEQATRYAWHLKVEWVVLTNFKEIRLYNSYYRKPADGLRLQLRFPQFMSELDRLWILSLPSVQAGELDKIEKRAERKNIDEAVLEDLLEIRRHLSDEISSSNTSLAIGIVRENVQKIMDRLIVIRVAEDKGLIGFESLRKELESWKNRGLPTPFMRSLKSLFRDFDDIYNTKLFEPHKCEDLPIENKVLETVIDVLYQYNFDLISADVLGAIYEDYLGHVLQETTSGGVQIIESSEARKKEGIYYTPTHLVEHVVKETLGELLEKCESPDDVAKIKILDPACGSGSFLIKAFDAIKEWYENYNSKLNAKSESLVDHLRKITDIECRILADNLFGVDIDPEAAEIAAVNLMLKAIKRGQKLPRHINPVYEKYITEKLINSREFVEYYRALSPSDRVPKDTKTEGIIKKLLVRDEGEWLSFTVDYLDQGQRRIVTDCEILRCRFKDREIRTFLLNEINSRGSPNRGKRLLDKILSVKLPSFHKNADRNKELIIAQLKPFLRDFDSHCTWKNEYRSCDDRLNKRVYQIYELDEEEVRHVEENSKQSGWVAEEAT